MLCFVGVEWNRMDEIKEINENWREDFAKKKVVQNCLEKNCEKMEVVRNGAFNLIFGCLNYS